MMCGQNSMPEAILWLIVTYVNQETHRRGGYNFYRWIGDVESFNALLYGTGLYEKEEKIPRSISFITNFTVL